MGEPACCSRATAPPACSAALGPVALRTADADPRLAPGPRLRPASTTAGRRSSCNRAGARLDPDEWVWVVAHLLLHLGLGHLADDRRRDAAADAAACLEVNRFLRESRVGREPIPLPAELPAPATRRCWPSGGGTRRARPSSGTAGPRGFGPDVVESCRRGPRAGATTGRPSSPPASPGPRPTAIDIAGGRAGRPRRDAAGRRTVVGAGPRLVRLVVPAARRAGRAVHHRRRRRAGPRLGHLGRRGERRRPARSTSTRWPA